MTPKAKKQAGAIAREIGNIIGEYIDDPSDRNLEMLESYFQSILDTISGMRSRRNVDEAKKDGA